MSFYDDLKSLVVFEEETSLNYPWALSSKEILRYHKQIKDECKGKSDTDALWAAIEKICGANPELLK